MEQWISPNCSLTTSFYLKKFLKTCWFQILICSLTCFNLLENWCILDPRAKGAVIHHCFKSGRKCGWCNHIFSNLNDDLCRLWSTDVDWSIIMEIGKWLDSGEGNTSEWKLKLPNFHWRDRRNLSDSIAIFPKPDLLFVHVNFPLEGQISIKSLFSTNWAKSWMVLMGGKIPPTFSFWFKIGLKSPPRITWWEFWHYINLANWSQVFNLSWVDVGP